ncbi:HlyC/CorC family transporter [Candidatus Poribacteria bacterium]|nr:HlyC/CorC family transporter [Candidatus Poribacteria bacterium]
MDEQHIAIRLVCLGILLILNALFSAAEALLARLTRADILKFAEEGGKRYEVLTSLLHHPRRYSLTIITAKTLLMVASVVLFTTFWDNLILSGGLAVLLLVVFTELFPKNYVQNSPSGTTIHALRALRIVYWGGFLILIPLNFLVNLFIRICGGKVTSAQDSLVSPEVLETLDNVADSQNILEPDDREMIARILDLPDKVVREIMVARTDMVCLEVETPASEVLQTTIACRHTRIPIYEETIDNIVGILHVKDMLDCWAEEKPINLSELIIGRTPFFTPESKKISELFRELREHKQHIAIVVDEYGGTAGIVTLENIIEEIVGEIQDEDEVDEQDAYMQISPNVYSVDARLNLVELNEKLGTELDAENIDTIGGFLVDHLGRVPEEGDVFTYRGIGFTILEADERRIHRIQIQMPNNANDDVDSE